MIVTETKRCLSDGPEVPDWIAVQRVPGDELAGAICKGLGVICYWPRMAYTLGRNVDRLRGWAREVEIRCGAPPMMP